MLTIAQIKSNKKNVQISLEKRGIKNAIQLIENVLYLDTTRKKLQAEHDDLLAQKNSLAKQIGQLMQSGKKNEVSALKETSDALKPKITSLFEQMKKHASAIENQLLNLPNLPDDKVPEGNSSEDNQVIESQKIAPKLKDHELAPHWELAKKYNLIDFDLGNKITGAGFPVYMGKGAQLQRALIQFSLDMASKAGYLEVQPPIMVNEKSVQGTGQLPDKEGQMYHIASENLYLIPTAEVPLTNVYRNSTLSEESLPIKIAGYTPCFRKEAGSWGSHVRGLNRLHQFDKVELVQIQKPEEATAAFNSMVQYVKSLYVALGLPFRILNLCAGDLGFTSSLTYDIEVWAVGQKRWLEVSSISNFKTYQSNRLKIKYKNAEGKSTLLYTLNGSGMALPRTLAAILEFYQTTDGIIIPNVLQPYTKFDFIQ